MRAGRARGSAFFKTIVRSIGGSLGRFCAIMGIVALGCGFYAGLQMCGPDMRLAADVLYDGTNLYDIRLASTLGFTDKDVARVSEVEGVEVVMPAASCDVMVRMGSEQLAMRMSSLDVDVARASEEQGASAVASSDEGYVNRVFLREGRWPRAPDECVLCADKDVAGMGVGDTIEVLYGTTELDDVLKERMFRVVGLVSSPNYPYTGSFGSTTLGSGTIGEYAYVSPEAFVDDAPFTELFVRVDGAVSLESGSDEYEAVVDEVRARLEGQGDSFAQSRLQDVRADAQEELDEATRKYQKEKRKANKELADAQEELDEAKGELEDAKAKLEEAKTELEDGESELGDGERAYAEGADQLASSKDELDAAQQVLDESYDQIQQSRLELEDGESEWQVGKQELLDQLGLDAGTSLEAARTHVEDMLEELRDGTAQLTEGIQRAQAGIEEAQAGIEALKGAVAALDAQLAQTADPALAAELGARRAGMQSQLGAVEAGLAQAQATKEQLERQLSALPDPSELEQALEGIDRLEETRVTLDEGARKLAQGEDEYAAGVAQYEDGVDRYNDGEAELEESASKLEDARAELAKGRAEYEDGQAEYEDGLREYEDGRAEYEQSRKKAQKELADAKRELDDAQADIDAIEAPDIYVLDRSQHEGVMAHNADSHRMNSIADVFPFIFFLVAALVSLTTMTRMVDDDRIEIGTYKALGYSTARIASKYLLYAGAASVVGAVVGIAVLCQALPYIVMSSYGIIYTVPLQGPPFAVDAVVVLLSGGLGVGVTLLATWAAVVASLRETPATLMLPRAPASGKRILLERVGPVWRRLSFSWKVTCRNLFRYKRRLAMTVIGISGCTALLLTGFGLHDAIWDIIDGQYGPVYHFDTTVGLKDEATEDDVQKVVAYLEQTGAVDNLVRIQSQNMQAGTAPDDTMAVSVRVPRSADELERMVTLRDRLTKEPVPFDDEAVVVTEKLCSMYGLAAGDKIVLYEQDAIGNVSGKGAELRITGVAENYVAHIVYVGKNAWKTVDDDEPVFSTIFARTQEDEAVRAGIADALHDFGDVSTVAFIDETIGMYRNMLSVVDLVVVVLIVSAGLLAFIVLYNLTNINIGERVREIASLKVLGFTKREVYAYIFREIALLSVLGDVLGMVLGSFLATFVVTTAEVDYVMFGRQIHPLSYVYAFALTLAFTALILLLMRGKLDKVDMVESLKSVD
ncbi:MAG: FtsX-like permease family protein [Atopobiaceae bacterium]|nr:FtsX-like permease family protein [Atopobiaceae bacterium]